VNESEVDQHVMAGLDAARGHGMKGDEALLFLSGWLERVLPNTSAALRSLVREMKEQQP
jgi:hypothetical protein